jgi:hypothetical protein
MTVTETILNFRTFLLNSWPSLTDVMMKLDWDEYPYFLDNWLQVNWEFFVEKLLLESKENNLLVPYGYDISSKCKHLNKDITATHQIMCKTSKESNMYRFVCFVTSDNGAYSIAPPFDLVDLENTKTNSKLTLPIKELDFFIEPTPKNHD